MENTEDMSTCYFCKGHVKPALVRHVHQWGERIIIFDDVPAEVCVQCGETYFGPDALEKMDQITLSGEQPEKELVVPVYSLSR